MNHYLPADHPLLMRRYELPSDQGIEREDRLTRKRAQEASQRLLAAILQVAR